MSGQLGGAIIAEIEELLRRAGLAPGDSLALGEYGSIRGMTDSDVVALNTSWLAAVERLAPTGSGYLANAQADLKRVGASSGYASTTLVGVLNALRLDYQAGFTRTVEELIHADVFADFLEMSDELLAKGFKDAAAVITGSVLEEHLRKLADRAGLPTSIGGSPKKADSLNADLAKAGVYNKLEQKNVTAWLGLRNDAAHGHYQNYDEAQVRAMTQSVRDFLARHPA